jgi:hypothetical protein
VVVLDDIISPHGSCGKIPEMKVCGGVSSWHSIAGLLLAVVVELDAQIWKRRSTVGLLLIAPTRRLAAVKLWQCRTLVAVGNIWEVGIRRMNI